MFHLRPILIAILVISGVLCLAPTAGARSKLLPIPIPSAGDGTIVQATFRLRPVRSGGKLAGRPRLRLKGKPGARQFALGAVKRLKRNTYRATILLFQKNAAAASAATPKLKAIVVAPKSANASPWFATTSVRDVLRNYQVLLRTLRLEQLQRARLAKLTRLELTTLTLRQIADAIRALANQQLTPGLTTLVGGLGGQLPAGFGTKKTTPPPPAATLAVDHSVTGPTTTLCAHIATSQTYAGSSAAITVTRLADSATFGPKTLFLDEFGSGLAQFEINSSDTVRTDLAVTTVDGTLKASADGIGPLVSNAQCPPAS